MHQCNQSHKCTFHQKENCVHGNNHLEQLGCSTMCMVEDLKGQCIQIENGLELNPSNNKKQIKNPKLEYVQYFDYFKESTVGTAIFKLNELCKKRFNVRIHCINETETNTIIIYSYQTSIKNE